MGVNEERRMTDAPSGWYADPTRRHLYRCWNGQAWTDRVSNGGTSGVDPAQMDAHTAATPPAPGTAAPAPAQTPAQQPRTATRSSSGTGLGVVLGVLITLLIMVVEIDTTGSMS
jgi:hypothetical protein